MTTEAERGRLTESIRLTRGVARDIELHLFDQDDTDEDLSAASLAVVSFKLEADAADVVTKKQSAAQITIADNKLAFALTAVDTALFVRDTYIGQASVSIGGETFTGDPFFVVVDDKIVEDA